MSEYQPDWSKAPDGARFWARDSDGAAWWYERRPDAGGGGFGNGGRQETDTNACPNWRETLQERPAPAPDRNDWSNAPDWARARAWDDDGFEHWFDNASMALGSTYWMGATEWLRVSDYRWPTEGWRDSLLLRPIDKPTEIRKIREELAALTERLAKLEGGA
jgi:hypothetical protein